jgi:putative methionine-R-sulfoxide reductase with GAF domain
MDRHGRSSVSAVPRDKGLNGVAVNTRDAVISQDVANDPRYLTAFATTGAEAIFPVLGDSGCDTEPLGVTMSDPGDKEIPIRA